MKATAIANANIALIKYWGRDENKVPFNSSLSLTLDSQLLTKTLVEFGDFENDEFILNNNKENPEKVTAQLDNVRKIANSSLKAKIISENSFPHSAGLAASASGFCALTAAACKALNLNLTKEKLSNLSAISPSGSSSRSVFSGFVEWNKENNQAVQLYKEDYWPELRDVIIIVSEKEKIMPSSEAMQLSVKNKNYPKRIKKAENHLVELKTALKNKDKENFFKTIMKENNSLHSIIKDTNLQFLNQDSRKIIEIINQINKNKTICAYTFDAGPNAHIITTEDKIELIKDQFKDLKIIVARPGKGVKWI